MKPKRKKRPGYKEFIEWINGTGNWSYGGSYARPPIPPKDPDPNWQSAVTIFTFGLVISCLVLAISLEQTRLGRPVIWVLFIMAMAFVSLLMLKAISLFREYLEFKQKRKNKEEDSN